MAYYKCGSIHPTQNSNVVIDTASGPIANFETPLAMPLPKIRFDFKAMQDLHGQSGAYPAGGGTNLWNEEWEVGTYNTNTGDKSTVVNRIRSKDLIPITPNSTIYFSQVGSGTGMSYCFYDENKVFKNGYYRASTTGGWTVSGQADWYYVSISPNEDYGTTYNNNISVSMSTKNYAPYSNICPIDGVSEVKAGKYGRNLFSEKFFEDNGFTHNQDGSWYIGTNALNIVMWENTVGYKGQIKIHMQYKYDDANLYPGLRPKILYTDGSGETIWTSQVEEYTVINATSSSGKVVDKIVTNYGAQANGSTIKDFCVSVDGSTEYQPYNPNSELKVIALGGTYYGGYVTQDKDGKRELVVTHKITDLGELTWGYSVWGAGSVFAANIPLVKDQTVSSVKGDIICSIYNNVTASEMYNSNPNYSMCLNRNNVRIANSDYSNKGAFKTAMSGIMLVYPLAEPFTVALPDGEPIKSLPGVNNIFADTGDTTVEFRKIGD